jgi:hypothetical protein
MEYMKILRRKQRKIVVKIGISADNISKEITK